MRFERRRGTTLTLILGLFVLGTPATASAQLLVCGIDYDGNGALTTADVVAFVGLWTAGNQLADLNGDSAVDLFDVNTFTAYLGFTPCPSMVDYQYNRVIDRVDAFFFQTLWSAGHPRADLNQDGANTVTDVSTFNALFGITY